MASLPRGLTRDRYGVRARLRVGGVAYEKRFKPDTPIALMLEWREDTRSDARRGRLPERSPGTFAADAGVYLDAVKAMPTFKERKRDIGLWVTEFGARPRREIKAHEIRAVRDRWLTVGPKMVQRWSKAPDPLTRRRLRTFEPVEQPLSASCVNHRLRALENLWTVLDGRHAPNPVRSVPEASEPDAPPRALPVAIVRALLDAMPTGSVKAGLLMLAWVGIPPATLARMKASMADLEGRELRVPGRLKGQGTSGRRVPLTTNGVEACRAMTREGAWGKRYTGGSATRMVRQACRVVEAEAHARGVRLDLSGVRPYDLRHSIGTLMYQEAGDLKATEGLLGVSHQTAARYAKGAINPRLLEAVKALERGQRSGESAKTGQNP